MGKTNYLKLIFSGLAFLISIILKAQNLEPIWGLNWGMTMTNTLKTIKIKKGIFPVEIKGDSLVFEYAVFEDQIFDHHKAALTNLFFFKRKLLRCDINFIVSNTKNETIFNLYDSIKIILSTKYFQPQFCQEKTYGHNKSEVFDSILNLKKEYFCNWFFPKNDPKGKGGYLTLQITEKGYILLTYDYEDAYAIINSDF